LTNVVTVVQAVVKFAANVPRVLLFEVIEKVTVPFAVIARDAGEMVKLTGAEVVMVPAVFEVITMLPALPPLFFIDREEGSITSLQPPEPVPVTGGPASPNVLESQSTKLLCVPVPEATVTGAMPAVPLTVA
jgi:hypothetical protein